MSTNPQVADHQPAFAQVSPEIEEITQAKRSGQERKDIRRQPENKERRVGDVRAEWPDPIVHRLVGRDMDKREIVVVERKLRHQQRQRHQQYQRNADHVRKTLVRIRRLS